VGSLSTVSVLAAVWLPQPFGVSVKPRHNTSDFPLGTHRHSDNVSIAFHSSKPIKLVPPRRLSQSKRPDAKAPGHTPIGVLGILQLRCLIKLSLSAAVCTTSAKRVRLSPA